MPFLKLECRIPGDVQDQQSRKQSQPDARETQREQCDDVHPRPEGGESPEHPGPGSRESQVGLANKRRRHQRRRRRRVWQFEDAQRRRVGAYEHVCRKSAGDLGQIPGARAVVIGPVHPEKLVLPKATVCVVADHDLRQLVAIVVRPLIQVAVVDAELFREGLAEPQQHEVLARVSSSGGVDRPHRRHRQEDRCRVDGERGRPQPDPLQRADGQEESQDRHECGNRDEKIVSKSDADAGHQARYQREAQSPPGGQRPRDQSDREKHERQHKGRFGVVAQVRKIIQMQRGDSQRGGGHRR